MTSDQVPQMQRQVQEVMERYRQKDKQLQEAEGAIRLGLVHCAVINARVYYHSCRSIVPNKGEAHQFYQCLHSTLAEQTCVMWFDYIRTGS